MTPLLADTKKGIGLNGVGGDGAHETLLIEPKNWEDLNFCKTERKEYDEVVTCVLLRAYMLAPENFSVR